MKKIYCQQKRYTHNGQPLKSQKRRLGNMFNSVGQILCLNREQHTTVIVYMRCTNVTRDLY